MEVVFCDDSRADILFYSNLLTEICKKNDISLRLTKYLNSEKMMFDLEDRPTMPDLVYLDVRMPGRDGLETANAMRSLGCTSEIVFLTVNDMSDTILKAFDVDALNYLVKGKTGTDRFEQIFLKAYDRCKSKKQEMLMFSCAGESVRVAVNDILYFEARDHCIAVHYGGGEFEFYSTIGKIENILSNRGFIRVHRSFVAATSKIVRISKNELTLVDGSVVPVGRSYQKLVGDMLEHGDVNASRSRC